MPTIFPSEFSEYRKSMGLTQQEMGNSLGVTAKYVGMLERGEKKVEETSSLGMLFRMMKGHDPDDAREAFVSRVADAKSASYRGKPACRMIPVVGWAHAGAAVDYEALPKDWQDLVPTECRDGDAFAVRLQGDSMEPRYLSGDLLVVMPNSELHSGCLAVVRTESGVQFRRVEMREEFLRLVPLNERYGVEDVPRVSISWAFPVWGVWRQEWR